ncbi:hypothetical protein E2C01_067968 [Portunus trituberculatus]|uniref:Uncharacterized protein n=1 Tax=Portunus trituberculatus TaxID=210409 RepID=A0A5B7HUJ3_PORTR|nr:hypothetical protein [Portunus trituberculatus]
MKDKLMYSSRVHMCGTINPHYSVHDIYTTKIGVNKSKHISCTDLRISRHSLALEEGRWNRRSRGHLPMEERLYSCVQVQTETCH